MLDTEGIFPSVYSWLLSSPTAFQYAIDRDGYGHDPRVKPENNTIKFLVGNSLCGVFTVMSVFAILKVADYNSHDP